jgi:NAD(P) transhydrogenase subunit beta
VTPEVWLRLGYLAAAVLFIVALRMMNHPATARRGNWLAAAGMMIAIAVTWIKVEDATWVIPALAVGAVLGIVMARRVAMTAMPQMVAILNGLGGGAVALVAVLEVLRPHPPAQIGVHLPVATTVLSAWIGGVAFSGSVVAFGKLQELLPGRPLRFPGIRLANFVLWKAAFLMVLWMTAQAPHGVAQAPFFVLLGLAVAAGLLLVLPIGGADMPVVIALLNSFTGVAAGLAGFVLLNDALLVGGALVGASGLILTFQMCDAMNRPLMGVLAGGFGGGGAVLPAAASGGTVRSCTPDDAAILFANASSVVVVPGYGMAVAQAQHAVKELASQLAERGVEVRYAIHPVAGRMPGHMNVLLAEADVPYDSLFDLEQINPHFPETDVALVIGANDVVNPAARHDAASPIYGMPILDVDRSKAVVVLKRSMSPGYAGVENELFAMPNTIMVFGDAKATVAKLTSALQNY